MTETEAAAAPVEKTQKEEKIQKVEEDEFPLKKVFLTAKNAFAFVKKFDFKAFFQGTFTFLSIIAAYFIIELSYEHSRYLEKIVKLKLKNPNTLPQMFLFLSLYLIYWNVIAHFLKKRALTPPVKSDEYEEIQESDKAPPVLEPLPNGQMYTHEIIYDSMTKTIYFFLCLASIGGYAYFNQEKRGNVPQLVTIERLNLCGLWFFTGIILDLFGRLLEKMTKISEFRVIGISIGFLVGALVLGLANGYNTFIFI